MRIPSSSLLKEKNRNGQDGRLVGGSAMRVSMWMPVMVGGEKKTSTTETDHHEDMFMKLIFCSYVDAAALSPTSVSLSANDEGLSILKSGIY